MKKLILVLGLTTILANPAFAADERSVKVEAGGGFISYGDTGSIGLMGRANIAIPIVDRAFDIGFEVEGGTSIDAENSDIGGIIPIDGVDTEVFITVEDFGIQNHMAGFAFFKVPLESGLGVIVRAGYHQSNFSGTRIIEVPANGTTDTEVFDIDFEGPAAGLGIEYFIGNSKKNGVRFDLTWHDTGDLNIDGGSTWGSLTYMRRF